MNVKEHEQGGRVKSEEGLDAFLRGSNGETEDGTMWQW
jgi:hypothetical protein